jgi:DNA-binding NtrC family response regulator
MARILVVDDDEQIRIMLEIALSRDSHEVVTAENGAVASMRQSERPADVVIIYIIMPEKEGFETIIEFRREYPKTKIIAISGGGQLGPDQYLKLAKTTDPYIYLSERFFFVLSASVGVCSSA